MNPTPTQSQVVDLDRATNATTPIAVIRSEPEELIEQKSLTFRNGFDDLDYLAFSILSLPSNRPVTLVRHKNSPSLGTQICVTANEPSVAETLVEAIRLLNFSIEDLSWIHPYYESKVKQALAGVA
ncbi:MAG: hypothetical protein N4J56_007150 [Chroococcidiopsis sp. SAG 2025]|uniref:hypothetical protein n=1 Tax=Chroococcidiopsis sp. SAG 2025 TaxID=171389 RepID=UPI002937013E|nr:hypothetical protein [Chroococcidiopsis sp. SAG 2025]MDV2997445.1 hypothetical protein [Chroococcidiopsis sp. SAG 2025]